MKKKDIGKVYTYAVNFTDTFGKCSCDVDMDHLVTSEYDYHLLGKLADKFQINIEEIHSVEFKLIQNVVVDISEQTAALISERKALPYTRLEELLSLTMNVIRERSVFPLGFEHYCINNLGISMNEFKVIMGSVTDSRSK